MISKIVVDALRRVELFQHLSPMQITEIARQSGRLMYQPDQVIARKGDGADGAILIIDGEVEQISGPMQLTRRQVEPGAVLAEMAMFTEFEFAATFVARSPVKAVLVEREAMLAQLAEEPKLAARLLEEVVERLRHVAVELGAAANIILDEDRPGSGEIGATPNAIGTGRSQTAATARLLS